MTRIRCAVYTRKSSDEGLDQSFNSLDAQREACEAYVRSQKQEGWKLLPEHYDDGGVSGGTMDRPALQSLLAEIDAGRIDMVVVYKVDRLTRSLADFSKLVDRLDETGASFVSVTQQFNTSTSMGRLTLNVLLSFAQFEREVTAERIRDKIAASKKKGMWMGGAVPIGYEKEDTGLVINVAEAATIRLLYAKYPELGCVRRLKEFADNEGLISKARLKREGATIPGKPFSRGQLYNILSNPLYIGKIRHKDEIYEGLQDAIIEQNLWEQVQDQLSANRLDRASRTNAKSRSLLVGKMFDENGQPLTPSHTSKRGKRYRYYVSMRLVDGRQNKGSSYRLPASEIEQAVADALRQDRELRLAWAATNQPSPTNEKALEQVAKVQIASSQLLIELTMPGSDTARTLAVPFTLQRRGVETKLVLQSGSSREPDLVLARRIHRAMHWVDEIKSGRSLASVARQENCTPEFIGNNLHFGLLSYRVLEAVFAGKLPATLSTQVLRQMRDLPMSWKAQDSMLLA